MRIMFNEIKKKAVLYTKLKKKLNYFAAHIGTFRKAIKELKK